MLNMKAPIPFPYIYFSSLYVFFRYSLVSGLSLFRYLDSSIITLACNINT
jgi:hypothetical protein